MLLNAYLRKKERPQNKNLISILGYQENQIEMYPKFAEENVRKKHTKNRN